MFDLGKLAFDLISKLIWGIIDDSLKSSALDFFEKRKVQSRVENATADVVQGIIPFLEQEKISFEKQQRLITTCVSELKPFAQNPAELFKGSLDGLKIFDALYHDKPLPQIIIEDDLKEIYSLLFPRIATLLCKIPAAVKDWENEAWSENYRRFDEVVAQLRVLFAQVDELANVSQKGADKTLTLLKRTLIQKIGLQLDITGLRADQPLSGKFDDFFVLPEIKQIEEEKDKKPVSVAEAEACFRVFTNPACLAIIIGAPGAGKSTWSKWLQRETLKTDWAGIGIRKEFRDLNVNELPSIYDLVRQSSSKQLREDLTTERIRKWLDNWQVVFILDGFDEVKPAERTRFVEWLQEINEIASGCPFILTSRPLTTDHIEKIGKNWLVWNIEPFNKERIVTYISQWYANTPLLNETSREIDAIALADSWLRDPTLGPLTNNPLLLSTLLMVHHLDGKLPNGRSNLYKRYVDGMLGIWDDRQKLAATDIQLNPREKRLIIRGIALHLFLTEQETIDENLLCEWLDRFLPRVSVPVSASDVLLVLRERSGLIIGPGIYSFAHKTIAEFLVAETVLQGDQQDDTGNRIDRFYLFEKRDNDRWNAVLFLWAGLAAYVDVNSFVEECIKGHNWTLGYGLLLDQYERFPVLARKKILNYLSLINDDDKSWDSIGWSSRYGNVSIDNMPSMELSGISGRNDLYSLLLKAIKDKTIVWSDFSSARGKIYDLCWGLFATSIIDLDEWRKVIQSDLPNVGTSEAWKHLIAGWLFFPGQKYFHQFVDMYRQVFPEYHDYITIIAIDYARVSLDLGRKERDKEKASTHLNNAFKSINFIVGDKAKGMSLVWAETRTWNGSIALEHGYNYKTMDLLSEFNKSLERSFDDKLVDSDTKEKAQVAINELIELRKEFSSVRKSKIEPKKKKSTKRK